jgi:hypothetical protein
MEVRTGYKQTEVGVIPEDWEVCEVGKKGDVVTGKALAVNGPVHNVHIYEQKMCLMVELTSKTSYQCQ